MDRGQYIARGIGHSKKTAVRKIDNFSLLRKHTTYKRREKRFRNFERLVEEDDFGSNVNSLLVLFSKRTEAQKEKSVIETVATKQLKIHRMNIST